MSENVWLAEEIMLQTMVDDGLLKMNYFHCQSILLIYFSGFDTEIKNIYAVYNETNHLTLSFSECLNDMQSSCNKFI